jgi:predicted RNA-binding Zn-ribbon protein involved in translation (DUF1610 family)
MGADRRESWLIPVADPVPILALGAAVAWVSLVTVEFYERIYRDRIKENSALLRSLADSQLETAINDLRKGKDVAINVEDIKSLRNAEQILMKRRKITLFLLFASSVFSIASSWSPSFEFTIPVTGSGGVAQEPMKFSVPTMAIGYVLMLAVFIAGFWFLWKMLWFDEQILKISGTAGTYGRPLCKSCGTGMELQTTYDMGKWRCPKCGHEAESEVIRFVPVGSNANPY